MGSSTVGSATSTRDPRLDFFRGVAMLIILVAHVPGNPWTLWIPARFGFSDATEIFVFCSGLASALAFGGVFVRRGWLPGLARVAFRAWQVYWAHVGVFIASTALLVAIDAGGWGLPGKRYVTAPDVTPFLDDPATGLVGLLTLRYVPGLFDILPMYIVVLLLIPVMTGVHRLGGGAAVAATAAMLWLLANLAHFAPTTPGGGLFAELGRAVAFLSLPADPWGDGVWFFNPFAWQLLFFCGFAFGMGWIKAPPITGAGAAAAAAILCAALPFAWFKLHLPDFYLPADWAIRRFFEVGRLSLEPLIAKTPLGLLRIAHFFALAYLALWLVGPLNDARADRAPAPGPATPDRARRARRAGAVALLTAPFAWSDLAGPAFVAWLPAAGWPPAGVLDLVHVGALATLVWNLASDDTRRRLRGDAGPALSAMVRKVGSQSLAVFMTSIPLSIVLGLAIDRLGGTAAARAAINLSGFAILVATAYVCSWFKSHPWRGRPSVDAAPGRLRAAAFE
jgi:hypothetical protein